jgi:hypothetical protein
MCKNMSPHVSRRHGGGGAHEKGENKQKRESCGIRKKKEMKNRK